MGRECCRLQTCPLDLKDLLAGSDEGKDILREITNSEHIRLLARNAQSLANARGHAMTADVLGRLTKDMDMAEAMRTFSASRGTYFRSYHGVILIECRSVLFFNFRNYQGKSPLCKPTGV